MKYKVYYKNKNINHKICNIILSLSLIASFISIFLFMINSFKIMVWVTFIIYLLKIIVVNRKEMFNKKESTKIYLKQPIVIDENKNVYLLQDLSLRFVLIPMAICFIMVIILELSNNILFYFALLFLVFFIQIGEMMETANTKYLKNNQDNLYNLINSKNLKYKVIKIVSIIKNENGSFILELEDGTKKEIYFDKEYNNYDELISSISN